MLLPVSLVNQVFTTSVQLEVGFGSQSILVEPGLLYSIQRKWDRLVRLPSLPQIQMWFTWVLAKQTCAIRSRSEMACTGLLTRVRPGNILDWRTPDKSVAS